MKKFWSITTRAVFALVLLLAATANLESTPPLWWDEGWTLSVARNWGELRHYGRLLTGELAPPGLEATFPVSVPVFLSFRLFGVGVWQGRLVGVAYMVGALAVIYYLAGRLYNQPVAIGTLVILLLMSPDWEMHPIIMGRQVLGEMPALFYLLAGYAFFLKALQRPLWVMPAAGLWGTAMITKAQALPFLSVSLLLCFSVTVFKRSWKSAALFGTSLLASLITYQWLLWFQHFLMQKRTIPGPIVGLYDVTALVPVGSIRLAVLVITLVLALPTVLGLGYETRNLIGNRDQAVLDGNIGVLRLALLGLAASWLAWYLFLSVGWTRYLFPATFISSIFAAAMLYKLTDHFSVSSTIKHGGSTLRHLSLNRQGLGALLAVVVVAIYLPTTLRMLYQSYFVNADASALQVVDFLNTQTAPDALVETYDSELFFLLNRRYHYPPDQIHVELNRRTFLGQDVSIDYDPLAANPDYLVVGPHSKLWRLYDPVLVTGAFRLLHSYTRYDVYERVR